MERRASRLALTFSCLGHAYMHVLTGLYLTVVLGLERDWQISYDELIRLWTLGSLLIGLGAPLAGWLADRWSQSRMMVVYFVVTGGGSVAAGLVDDTTGLWLALAVLGLGASIYHPVGIAWVVRNASRPGRDMGINGVFGSVGVAMAALVAALLTDLINWRAAFIIPGAVCLATGVALAVLIGIGVVADRSSDVTPQAAPNRGDAVRAFLVLSVTMVCAGLIYNALQVAMPKWFDADMSGLIGSGVLGVGGLVAIVYVTATLSQVAGGFLADRLPLRTVYAACLLLQVPLLVLASTLFDLPLLIVITGAVFIATMQLPTESLLLARYTPARHRGLAYGLKFVLSFGVTPLAVQLVAGTYAWSGDFQLLLWLLAGTALVAWLVALLLPGGARKPAAGAPVVAPAIPAE